jgi:ribosomal protein S26
MLLINSIYDESKMSEICVLHVFEHKSIINYQVPRFDQETVFCVSCKVAPYIVITVKKQKSYLNFSASVK